MFTASGRRVGRFIDVSFLFCVLLFCHLYYVGLTYFPFFSPIAWGKAKAERVVLCLMAVGSRDGQEVYENIGGAAVRFLSCYCPSPTLFCPWLLPYHIAQCGLLSIFGTGVWGPWKRTGSNTNAAFLYILSRRMNLSTFFPRFRSLFLRVWCVSHCLLLTGLFFRGWREVGRDEDCLKYICVDFGLEAHQ